MTTKDDVLKYLREQQGDWISGETLSNRMGISRSAVWKQISRLRQEGYVIQSTPNKGYVLSEIPEMLLPAEIGEGLDTSVFGKQGIVYEGEMDSTNRKARDLAVKGAPEGTLVVAEKQTGGRGRRGRYWFSPRKAGIYASLILRPKLPPNEAPKITLLTGVTVAEAFMALTPLKPAIKWPNDILVNGRKICGILTESSMEMDAIHHVVVGVGINVNTRKFPDELKEIGTSVYLETGRTFDRVALLKEFLRRFEEHYRNFLSSGFGSVEKRWRELAVVLGKEVTVRMIDATCRGRAVELDRDGALIIQEKNGERRKIYSGDIQIHGK
ncbi:MAG: biotin--[acetyl-CoA-carboxylase] ligase [Desulfatiglandaceae bacterium]|jgi:BirA family biotin operon repressor/biotin-[acetyl-CoA-carboxylase] ligase